MLHVARLKQQLGEQAGSRLARDEAAAGGRYQGEDGAATAEEGDGAAAESPAYTPSNSMERHNTHTHQQQDDQQEEAATPDPNHPRVTDVLHKTDTSPFALPSVAAGLAAQTRAMDLSTE